MCIHTMYDVRDEEGVILVVQVLMNKSGAAVLLFKITRYVFLMNSANNTYNMTIWTIGQYMAKVRNYVNVVAL